MQAYAPLYSYVYMASPLLALPLPVFQEEDLKYEEEMRAMPPPIELEHIAGFTGQYSTTLHWSQTVQSRMIYALGTHDHVTYLYLCVCMYICVYALGTDGRLVR